MQYTWDTIAPALGAVVVFRRLVQQAPLQALRAFLLCDADAAQLAQRYGAFVSALIAYDFSLSAFLQTALAEDENEYVIACAGSAEPSPRLRQCAVAELTLLSELTQLDANALRERICFDGYLPEFENTPVDLLSFYEKRLADVKRVGYGVFAWHTMFRMENGEITPVSNADRIEISDLTGYEQQRQLVIENSKALLAGKPAANVLLSGSAGTGKSSTVKAVVNLLAPEGLRLIELRKEQILLLPALMAKLKSNPLKFVIFIDDLSFSDRSDAFSTLKAILEGSTAARGDNVAIYATSNRRHLVRENFAERSGDDVHREDTMQELLSLSDRFGLVVRFYRPDKALFLRIVRALAEEKGVALAGEVLDARAEAYALRRGGRSPRIAAQFTDSLIAGEE
ncbi:MAG: ATP-binding protein [Oscillospiraceae bacterium]|jgi:predicted AAA+ superfamily ATPase|nr:ATP-binding protein [Oscillospiraceae bacterium]